MTQITSDSTLEALTGFIAEYPDFRDCEEEAEQLAKNTPYVEKTDSHNACRECGAGITPIDLGEEVEVVCMESSNDHVYRVDPSEFFTYSLSPDPVLDDIATELGYEGIKRVDGSQPEYVVGTVSDRVQIGLVRRTDAHERILDDLTSDAIKNGRVNAVFTPPRFEDMEWGSALRKPLAALAPPFPFELLSNSTDAVRRHLVSAAKVHNRNEEVLARANTDSNFLRHLNRNPRAIQLELDYAPLFRATSPPGSRRLSDRFEDVCSAAFETINFPDAPEGFGTDERGDVLPDILFMLSNESRYPPDEGGRKTLGIVDAKSNAEADIGGEQIVQKHAEYLQQADTPGFDHHHIAHVFVVLSMRGYESNEIDWYDAIESNFYRENVDDVTMVVLYADALAHMLDIYLSASQKNEANLAVGDVREVFRPFFNFRAFRRGVDEDIQEITRVDDHDPNAYEEGYREKYQKRERLLVVTPEMVDRHYFQRIDNHDQIGGLLSQYGDSL